MINLTQAPHLFHEGRKTHMDESDPQYNAYRFSPDLMDIVLKYLTGKLRHRKSPTHNHYILTVNFDAIFAYDDEKYEAYKKSKKNTKKS